MQHDGVKAHTEGTVQGTIEDSSFTGDGEVHVRVDVVQQPSSSPDCDIWGDMHVGLQCPPEGIQEIEQRVMELVHRAWDNIFWKVMDKSWVCLFNNLRPIMRRRGHSHSDYQPTSA